MPSFVITGQTPIIFTHIPCTGGSAIANWFYENEFYFQESIQDFNLEWLPLEFPSLTQIKESYPNSMTFPTVAVVRNPWARLVSGYESLKINPCLFYANKQLQIPTWEEFLASLDNFKTFRWYEITANQVSWIPQGVDFLLKTETLEIDFQPIKAMYGKPNHSLSIVQSSNHIDYKSYYNDFTKRFVATKFENDIDTFKYTF